MKAKEKFSEDWPLMQLHRQYGKDEAMKALFAEISSLKFRIGELESENSELNHLLYSKSTKSVTPGETKTAKEWKKEEFFQEIKKGMKAAQLRTRDLRKELEKWRNRYLTMFVKLSIAEQNSLINQDQNEAEEKD